MGTTVIVASWPWHWIQATWSLAFSAAGFAASLVAAKFAHGAREAAKRQRRRTARLLTIGILGDAAIIGAELTRASDAGDVSAVRAAMFRWRPLAGQLRGLLEVEGDFDPDQRDQVLTPMNEIPAMMDESRTMLDTGNPPNVATNHLQGAFAELVEACEMLKTQISLGDPDASR